jgi:endonuclease/exonuclease/phosphatase family metal-dependent hydrolase
MRLLCYNIRSLRDDRDAVVRVIRAAQPDVVCIQEAPKWWRSRSRCADLARRCDLVVITGGGNGTGHNLLMCTYAVDVHESRESLLSRRFGLHVRGVASAVCSLGGARFAVAGTHLDLDPAERLRHVPEVFAALEWVGETPLVLAGDINETPDGAAWQSIATRLVDVQLACGAAERGTYSASSGRRRIDGVFADARIQPLSATVLEGEDVRKASDHRPVLVELDVPPS